MKLSRYLISALAISLLLSCGPPDAGGESSTGCRPHDLHVEVNDHSMVVSWQSECDDLISGYNIYINEKPLAENMQEATTEPEPFNATPFAGDTNPGDGIQHYDADHLENGQIYFVSVRTVYSDRSLTKSSEEIEVVCGPRGEIELDVRYSSEQDGFSLDSNRHVRADNLSNDFYFYTVNGEDYLASPVRLDGFLKDNRLTKLPYRGDFELVARALHSSPVTPQQLRVEIRIGDWVLLQTAEKHHALLKVIDIRGSGEKRRIRLFYAFTALTDVFYF